MKTEATVSQPSAVPGSPLLQVSGAPFGIIAFILIAAWLAKRFLVDPMLGDLYASQLIARVPDSAVWVTMPLVTLAAMVLGGVAAQVALRSYVRK